jgi:hypothetical protein
MLRKRKFRATITDGNGESHEYDFVAPTVWAITGHIFHTMQQDGDFYGHKYSSTSTLSVEELVSDAALRTPTNLYL